MGASCPSCGTHTGTHWYSHCPQDWPGRDTRHGSNVPAPPKPSLGQELEEASIALDSAKDNLTLAQRAYDEALADFKKEYNL